MDNRDRYVKRIHGLWPRLSQVEGLVKLLWYNEWWDGPLTGMCELDERQYFFEFFFIPYEDGRDDDYEDEKRGQRYLLHSSSELWTLANTRQRERLEHIGDGNVYRDVLGKWTTHGGIDRRNPEYQKSQPDDDPISSVNLGRYDAEIVGWFFEDQTTGGTGAIDVWTKEQSEKLSEMEGS